MGASGVTKVGVVGIVVSTAVLGSWGIFVAKENQFAEQSENYTKKLPKKKKKRKKSEDLIRARDKYPWPQSHAHHHHPYQIRDPLLCDRLILRILKNLHRSLIKRQIYIKPTSGKTKNR